MFPYEIYYVLATDEEIERLDEPMPACSSYVWWTMNAAPSFGGVHYLKDTWRIGRSFQLGKKASSPMYYVIV